jgi:hypothetical protein
MISNFKSKTCWRCSATVPLDTRICPYCGAAEKNDDELSNESITEMKSTIDLEDIQSPKVKEDELKSVVNEQNEFTFDTSPKSRKALISFESVNMSIALQHVISFMSIFFSAIALVTLFLFTRDKIIISWSPYWLPIYLLIAGGMIYLHTYLGKINTNSDSDS